MIDCCGGLAIMAWAMYHYISRRCARLGRYAECLLVVDHRKFDGKEKRTGGPFHHQRDPLILPCGAEQSGVVNSVDLLLVH